MSRVPQLQFSAVDAAEPQSAALAVINDMAAQKRITVAEAAVLLRAVLREPDEVEAWRRLHSAGPATHHVHPGPGSAM